MTNLSEGPIDLGLPLPFQIMQLHSALNTQIKAIISRHGDLNLTQWRILRLLGWGIADTTTAVRKAAGIDKGQFSKTLSTLAEGGYVTLLPYPEDKRQHLIVLTDKGRAHLERLTPILDARQKHLLAGLSAEERDTLQKAIKVVAHAAKETEFDLSPQVAEEA